jgi:hypothetical protein
VSWNVLEGGSKADEHIDYTRDDLAAPLLQGRNQRRNDSGNRLVDDVRRIVIALTQQGAAHESKDWHHTVKYRIGEPHR